RSAFTARSARAPARSPACPPRGTRRSAPASASCSVPDPASPFGTSLRRARPSQGPLEQPPALHDDLEIVLGLQDAEVPERVARDDDQVGVLAGLDGAGPAGQW